MPDRSKYQDGVIKRYYKNKDTIMINKLTEMVSELYLADTPAKANKLWTRVEKALSQAEVHPSDIKRVMEKKDVKILAEVVGKL